MEGQGHRWEGVSMNREREKARLLRSAYFSLRGCVKLILGVQRESGGGVHATSLLREKFALPSRWRGEMTFLFTSRWCPAAPAILSYLSQDSRANLLKILPWLNKCFGLALIVERTKHNVLCH